MISSLQTLYYLEMRLKLLTKTVGIFNRLILSVKTGKIILVALFTSSSTSPICYQQGIVLMIPHCVEFYERDTISVAKDLLGCYLVRRIKSRTLVGKIVEVEAYLGEKDLACHASVGRTKRTRIFWGRPGVAYVFLIYGIYHCLNAITLPEGQAGCVLIR